MSLLLLLGGVAPDNSTLEGAAALAVTQSASLTGTIGIAGQSDWAVSQAAAIGLRMAVAGQSDWAISQAANLTRMVGLAGQSDWAVSQSSDLIVALSIVTLAGQANLVVAQVSDLGTIAAIVSLAGQANLVIVAADAETQMVSLWLAMAAAITINCSGTLWIDRAPVATPDTIVDALARRRSIIMPYPILEVTTGRPS